MEKWEKRWADNQLRWHKDTVDPLLTKHLKILNAQEEEESSSQNEKKFFVPLCGKTLDIAFILKLGYHVFAVEGVRQAIEQLNEENNFGLTFYEEDSTYRSPDEKLVVYHGDLFTCPVEKWAPCQYIWDKGALTAIDEQSRSKYIDVVQKSVQMPQTRKYVNFKYFLRTVNYDKLKSDGRGPKCVSESDMDQLYNDWASVHLLESNPLPEGHILRKNVDIGLICHEQFYLLTKKC